MKKISKKESDRLTHNWQRIPPQNLLSAVEKFDEKEHHYQRASVIDFGIAIPEFKELLTKIDIEKYGEKYLLSIVIGAWKVEETGLTGGKCIRPEIMAFFKFKIDGTFYLFASDSTLFDHINNVFQEDNISTSSAWGVSHAYERQAVANWSSLTPSELNDLFFMPKVEMDREEGIKPLPIDRVIPNRVSKFMFIPSDIKILKEKIDTQDHIKLVLGATYGHPIFHRLSVTPIVKISSEDSLENETPDPTTYLDFLRPCPPLCGPPPM